MKAHGRPFIVGFGGTVRPRSTSETALAKALEVATAAGARTEMFGGAFLTSLAHYNPHQPATHAGHETFVNAIREADGIIVATPGYHGSISGLVKNALDSLEALRDDARPYFDGRAVGCIVAAAGAQACGSTLAALRSIIHAMRGWPTPMAAALNTSEGLFDADGQFTDPRDALAIEIVTRQVMAFATAWGR